MQFTLMGTDVYPGAGGVRCTAQAVLSPTEMAYPKLRASQQARLRDGEDKSAIWYTTAFGRVVNATGEGLPDDDHPDEPAYSLGQGFAVEALEVSVGLVESLIDVFNRAAIEAQKLKLYAGFVQLPDLTQAGLDALQNKRLQAWDSLRQGTVAVSLESGEGVSGTTSVVATGVPLPGTFSCTYDSILGTAAVKFQLLRLP